MNKQMLERRLEALWLIANPVHPLTVDEATKKEAILTYNLSNLDYALRWGKDYELKERRK